MHRRSSLESARQEAAQLGLNATQQNNAALQAEEQFRQSADARQNIQRRVQQEQLEQSAFQFGEQARQRAADLNLSEQQQEQASERPPSSSDKRHSSKLKALASVSRSSRVELIRSESKRNNVPQSLGLMHNNRKTHRVRQLSSLGNRSFSRTSNSVLHNSKKKDLRFRLARPLFNRRHSWVLALRKWKTALDKLRIRLVCGHKSLMFSQQKERHNLHCKGLAQTSKHGRNNWMRPDYWARWVVRISRWHSRDCVICKRLARYSESLSQRGFDTGYQDFLRQQAFPKSSCPS